MKKVLRILLLALCLCGVLAGCGKKEEAEETKKEEKAKVQEETKEYLIIGNKTDKAYDILLKNSTGQDITGIAIKTSDKTEYPANMMKSGDVLKKGETAELFYTPEEAAKDGTDASEGKATGDTDAEEGKAAADTGKTDKTAAADTSGADDEEGNLADAAINLLYNVQVTLADGTKMELSSLGFEDIKEEAELCLEDEVCFVKYVSKASGDSVSTKEQELGAKVQREAQAAAEQKAAEEKAAAEAKAAEEAKAAAEAQAAAQAAQQQPAPAAPAASGGGNYSEPVYTEPAPAPEPAPEPAPAPETAPEQSSEGCLDPGELGL